MQQDYCDAIFDMLTPVPYHYFFLLWLYFCFMYIHYHFVPTHDDVIKWKHFPRCWPFVRGIHRSPVSSPHKGQWRAALMFSLICVWIISWVNNREAGDLRPYRAHYDVTVMVFHTLTEVAGNHTSHFLCWYFCNTGKISLFHCTVPECLELIWVNLSCSASARSCI